MISSTDAASVFNILRSKKLALKYHTDSLLEIESGSNDPISYMLTTVAVGIMGGQDVFIPLLLVQQIAIGALGGLLLGKLAIWSLRRGMFPSEQSQTIFVFAVVILSYALPTVLGGNGYLSSYLCGIYMGSTKLPQKRNLVHFFDVVTDVAQVLIFFLLGLLVTPVELPSVLLPALAIMVFLTFLARPAVVSVLMLPFRPSLAQVGVVSWAGLRGVASIVFAIMAVLQGAETRYNLFKPGVLHRPAVHLPPGQPAPPRLRQAAHDRPHRRRKQDLQRLPGGERHRLHQDPPGQKTIPGTERH